MRPLREMAARLRGQRLTSPVEGNRRVQAEAKRARRLEKARAGRMKAEKQLDKYLDLDA